MSIAASVILTAFACFLFGLAAVAFGKPALAERFFRGFARTAHAHYAEQTVRLLIGLALLARAPEMRSSQLFSIIGWALVCSAAALMLLPWRWHRALADRMMPALTRNVKAYAICLCAFGALLLYGLFAPIFDSHS